MPSTSCCKHASRPTSLLLYLVFPNLSGPRRFLQDLPGLPARGRRRFLHPRRRPGQGLFLHHRVRAHFTGYPSPFLLRLLRTAAVCVHLLLDLRANLFATVLLTHIKLVHVVLVVVRLLSQRPSQRERDVNTPHTGTTQVSLCAAGDTATRDHIRSLPLGAGDRLTQQRNCTHANASGRQAHATT